MRPSHDDVLNRNSNLKLTSKGADQFIDEMDFEDLKSNMVGRVTGFPQVMSQFKESNDAINYVLGQKKAVKMTQMPLFIEDSNHIRNM